MDYSGIGNIALSWGKQGYQDKAIALIEEALLTLPSESSVGCEQMLRSLIGDLRNGLTKEA